MKRAGRRPLDRAPAGDRAGEVGVVDERRRRAGALV